MKKCQEKSKKNFRTCVLNNIQKSSLELMRVRGLFLFLCDSDGDGDGDGDGDSDGDGALKKRK